MLRYTTGSQTNLPCPSFSERASHGINQVTVELVMHTISHFLHLALHSRAPAVASTGKLSPSRCAYRTRYAALRTSDTYRIVRSSARAGYVSVQRLELCTTGLRQ